MKKYLQCILPCLLAVLLCACGAKDASTASSAAASSDVAGAASKESSPAASSATAAAVIAAPTPASEIAAPAQETVTLYIGWADYLQTCETVIPGEVTPEALIDAISAETGWNLSLADAVTSGKGGMTVCFAADSAIFTGPPEPQNDKYHVFDSTQLIQAVLDSVQATLQNYYTAPGGDPSALDIYFCADGDTAIAIPDMGKTIAIDAPYHSADYFE